MKPRYLFAIVLALSAFVGVSPAHALLVRSTESVGHEFEGATCGSTPTALVTLPRGARNARIVEPGVGEVLPSDDEDGTSVATITIADLAVTDAGRIIAGWQATGSDDVCSRPEYYVEEGWGTPTIDLVVAFTRLVRVYVRGLSGPNRRRPGSIDVGASGRLSGLSWSSWDGAVARGRGTGPGGAPVAVRLSRPTECDPRYQYLRVRYRYTGAVPEGRRRANSVSLGSTC